MNEIYTAPDVYASAQADPRIAVITVSVISAVASSVASTVVSKVLD